MQVVWANKNNNTHCPDKGEGMDNSELTQYFNPSLFNTKLKAKTKLDCLEELTTLFVENKDIRTGGIVLTMLRERELLGSTGIGKNVAIPHGRTTATMEVKIAFGRSETGIDFGSTDKKPVKLIFVVLAPPQDKDNKYLPILGKLVEVLSVLKNRNKLLKVEAFEEFIDVIEGK